MVIDKPVIIQNTISNKGSCQTTPLLITYNKVPNIPKIGIIAGCYITKGKVVRNAMLRVRRAEEIIHEGKLTSLKRFKDDTSEVLENYECGIGVDGFHSFIENDIIEVYEIKEIKRTLS